MMKHAPFIRHTDGDKVVLCIHGFLGSPRHFDMFIPYISDDFAVCNILLPGHGSDVLAFGRTSMAEWKSHVENTMQELTAKYNEIWIVGHSMGTFFAMDCAERYPQYVKKLFLLASPLRISVGLFAVKNSLKSLFSRVKEDDETGIAYANAHSVKLNLKFWEYIFWIPRYLELFSASRRMRKKVCVLALPCTFYQSKKDELVSYKSTKYITENNLVKLRILKQSHHFIYSKEDTQYLIREFIKFLS